MSSMSPQRASTEHAPTTSAFVRRYRVGGWVLEWSQDHPHTLWAIPEGLKEFRQASGGIYYGEDSTPPMAWDLPTPPQYVRKAAVLIMQGLHKDGGK
jgi:hypothetical protein